MSVTAIQLMPLAADNTAHLEAVAELWTDACGQDLPISTQFVAYNLTPSAGGSQAGRLAVYDGRPVGFVLASRLAGEPEVMAPEVGWLDALAVAPQVQGRGAGSTLLEWAEGWLRQQGCTHVTVGGSLRPFVPAVPTEVHSDGFFAKRGYTRRGEVWDVAADLAGYQSPEGVDQVDAAVRPAQRGQEEALLAFLEREFPGRWRYEFQEVLRHGERFSDYMLLWTERGVDGFCQLTFPDSVRPMERFYPYRLSRPWGQLGSVGVSEESRGKGFGLAVVDAGLRRLRDTGINGCVIDWTTITDFYAKFGFTKYRSFQQMAKEV